MVKQLMINFEITKGERTFIFSMPHGTPFGEAYDACFEVLSDIVKMSTEAADKAKRPEEEKAEIVEQLSPLKKGSSI